MKYDENIIPFEGTESIRLYSKTGDVKAYLTDNHVRFTEEKWYDGSETVFDPWTVIIIEDKMSLFFAANGKLFKMVFGTGYSGKLPNGVHTGMKTEDAERTDSGLKYDDWNEDYESPSGYWLEENSENGTIMTLSVFIREALDEDTFDRCEW